MAAIVATEYLLRRVNTGTPKIGQMPHGLSAVVANARGKFALLLRKRGRHLCHFLLVPIPLIQPRQMIDFMGSSKARAFRANDFGQPSHQGNSKPHNLSPGKPSPPGTLRRHENGAWDCSMTR